MRSLSLARPHAGRTLPSTRSAFALLVSASLAVLALASACAVDVADTGESAPGEASEAPVNPDVTYYVVGFHWGWAVFDQGGNELDGIRVTEGTTVELFATNAHATEAIDRFPAPVAAAIKSINWAGERTRLEIAEGRLPDPEVLIGMTLDDVLGHDDDHADGGHADEADDHAAEARDDHADGPDAHTDDADEHADADEHGDAGDHDDADEHADAGDHDDADEHADAGDHDDADEHGDADEPDAAGDHEDADEHEDGDEHDADTHTQDVVARTQDVVADADDAAADHADEAAVEHMLGLMAAWEMPWQGEERVLETHGLLIPWHGVVAKLEPDASEPVHVVFTTDRAGAYKFECVVYCGFGHRYQQRDMLFVEAAQ